MSCRDQRINAVLIDEQAIRQRVAELAAELADAYSGADLTIVAVLDGSLVFLADLMRALPMNLRIELIRADSYGAGTESSGRLTIVELSDLSQCLRGRDVLLLDDILDSGRTLSKIHARIVGYQPNGLKTCVLLDKPSRRVVDFEADFHGFEIPNHFVVGYGLDFNGEFRNLPYIAILRDPE